jgi:hypothetical protein
VPRCHQLRLHVGERVSAYPTRSVSGTHATCKCRVARLTSCASKTTIGTHEG